MKQTLKQNLVSGSGKIATILRRLFSFFWTDHNGNNITDHNGNNIEFRTRRR